MIMYVMVLAFLLNTGPHSFVCKEGGPEKTSMCVTTGKEIKSQVEKSVRRRGFYVFSVRVVFFV